MSHGGGDDSGEPNLVPLLDLVLQLVMFFMMCTNLAMEQLDENIKLPVAQSAVPTQDATGDIIYLNVNAEGKLLVPGRNQPLDTGDELQVYLRNAYDDALAKAKREAEKRGETEKVTANALVIIRAHRDAKYLQVYNIMRKCQDVGLRKIQLRAIIQTGS